MKKYICITFIGLLTACDSSPVNVQKLTEIEVVYSDAKVFGDKTVACESKTINNRDYVSCHPYLATNTAHIWLFEKDELYALNGPARAAYENYFEFEPGFNELLKPTPEDIDISSVFIEFTE